MLAAIEALVAGTDEELSSASGSGLLITGLLVLLAAVAASLLYVVFGLKTWVRESRLLHLSLAEGLALSFILASLACAGLGAPESDGGGILKRV